MDKNIGNLAAVFDLQNTINFPKLSIVSVSNRWWLVVALGAQISRSVCVWFK
jgi:hypothetical protein